MESGQSEKTDGEGGGEGGGERGRASELRGLIGAVVGLVLVIVPAITSFYAGGLIDFSVEAVFVAGALGLPLVLIGFSATREGRAVASGLQLVLHQLLTAAALVIAVVFALRDEPAAGILFALAVIALGAPLILMRPRPAP